MHYSLCDMFSDLTQNSIEAGASVVTVRLIQDEASVRFSVEDNGKGMSLATLQKASDHLPSFSLQKNILSYINMYVTKKI